MKSSGPLLKLQAQKGVRGPEIVKLLVTEEYILHVKGSGCTRMPCVHTSLAVIPCC